MVALNKLSEAAAFSHDGGVNVGDIVMFWVMGKPTILLGRMEHAEALLQKRMMNYGDRPELIMAQE